MLHPDAELRFINPLIGHGVVARRRIPKGTITWVKDLFDQTFSPIEVGKLTGIHRELLDKYGFADARGQTVLCWDHARFMNHSCEPTCMSPALDLEIAIRDIEPGEELSDDYGTLFLDTPFDCLCGVAGCRRMIWPEDADRYAGDWRRTCTDAFPAIAEVAQPLWDLLPDPGMVLDVLAGRRTLPLLGAPEYWPALRLAQR